MPQERDENRWKQDLYDYLQTFIMAAVALVLLFMFVGRLNRVDGESMDPTLADGEFMLVQSIGYTPQPGDVVVLHKDFDEVQGPIVKRVIAVGGQTVEIDYDAETVSVDGEILYEPYLLESMRDVSQFLTVTQMEVPHGSVFVMGDNRNGSNDSRNAALGAVDCRYILGHARFVLLPFSQFGAIREQ